MVNNENSQSLSAQGNSLEKELQLGGTTNLSLEQLTKDRGVANPAEDNPNGLTDQDDLNEIRVGDDLNEPDVEEYQPDDQDNDFAERPDIAGDDVDGEKSAESDSAN